MTRIDYIGRALTIIISSSFFVAGVFDVLDNFVIKYLLFASFISVVLYMFFKLYQNENHPKV